MISVDLVGLQRHLRGFLCPSEARLAFSHTRRFLQAYQQRFPPQKSAIEVWQNLTQHRPSGRYLRRLTRRVAQGLVFVSGPLGRAIDSPSLHPQGWFCSTVVVLPCSRTKNPSLLLPFSLRRLPDGDPLRHLLEEWSKNQLLLRDSNNSGGVGLLKGLHLLHRMLLPYHRSHGSESLRSLVRLWDAEQWLDAYEQITKEDPPASPEYVRRQIRLVALFHSAPTPPPPGAGVTIPPWG